MWRTTTLILLSSNILHATASASTAQCATHTDRGTPAGSLFLQVKNIRWGGHFTDDEEEPLMAAVPGPAFMAPQPAQPQLAYIPAPSGAFMPPTVAAMQQVPQAAAYPQTPWATFFGPWDGGVRSYQERLKSAQQEVAALNDTIRDQQAQLEAYAQEVARLANEEGEVKKRAIEAERVSTEVIKEATERASKDATEKQQLQALLDTSREDTKRKMQEVWAAAAADLTQERSKMEAALRDAQKLSDAQLKGYREQMAQEAGEAKLAVAQAQAASEAAKDEARELARLATAADERLAQRATLAEQALGSAGAYPETTRGEPGRLADAAPRIAW